MGAAGKGHAVPLRQAGTAASAVAAAAHSQLLPSRLRAVPQAVQASATPSTAVGGGAPDRCRWAASRQLCGPGRAGAAAAAVARTAALTLTLPQAAKSEQDKKEGIGETQSKAHVDSHGSWPFNSPFIAPLPLLLCHLLTKAHSHAEAHSAAPAEPSELRVEGRWETAATAPHLPPDSSSGGLTNAGQRLLAIVMLQARPLQPALKQGSSGNGTAGRAAGRVTWRLPLLPVAEEGVPCPPASKDSHAIPAASHDLPLLSKLNSWGLAGAQGPSAWQQPPAAAAAAAGQHAEHPQPAACCPAAVDVALLVRNALAKSSLSPSSSSSSTTCATGAAPSSGSLEESLRALANPAVLALATDCLLAELLHGLQHLLKYSRPTRQWATPALASLLWPLQWACQVSQVGGPALLCLALPCLTA